MNAPAPAGSFGGAGNGLQQEDQRLFQIVLHDLKQNWNPQGWQQELQPTNRARVIIQMYVTTRFLSFFKTKTSGSGFAGLHASPWDALCCRSLDAKKKKSSNVVAWY